MKLTKKRQRELFGIAVGDNVWILNGFGRHVREKISCVIIAEKQGEVRLDLTDGFYTNPDRAYRTKADAIAGKSISKQLGH